VSIPIGNPLDLTLRAQNTLKNCQVLLVEEIKPARVLLKGLSIGFYEGEFQEEKQEVYLFRVDENVDGEDLEYLRSTVFPGVERAAYISGSGSPLFEDPGALLESILSGFQIERIPGLTSLSALMMYFPAHMKRFSMEGFLPQKSGKRRQELERIKRGGVPAFLMETPYRRQRLLEELCEVLPTWNILLGYKLTMKEEKIFKGRISRVKSQMKTIPKGEFVLLIYP